MIQLLVLPVIAVGLWVAWEPMKRAVSRGRAMEDLQSEEVREEVLEVKAEVNVKKQDNDKEEMEIKL